MADYGGKPGSVLVDLGFIETAPDRKYPYLVIAGPRAHNCDKHSLPDKDEIPVLEEILEATTNFIIGVTAKELVGTFTYNCERVNYYYVKDTVDVRNALLRMYNRGYKDYNYVLKMKYDPEWLTYRKTLYPNEETQNWMENNKIITQMLVSGDSLTTQRHINFDLCFRTDTDRSAFMDSIRWKGYKVEKKLTSASNNAPYELILSQYSYVKSDFIDPLTADLKREARKYRGFYLGWEAKK